MSVAQRRILVVGVHECMCRRAQATMHVIHLWMCLHGRLIHSIVCGEPGAHSRTSAPRGNPFAPGHFGYICIPCTQPYSTSVSSPVESHETALHPELASGSWRLAASVCISAQEILTKEVTDLPLSLTICHVHVWPNIAQEWATHRHTVRLMKWTIGRCSNSCFSGPAVDTGYTKCEIRTHVHGHWPLLRA